MSLQSIWGMNWVRLRYKVRSEFSPVNNNFPVVMGLALLSTRKIFLVASI